LNAHVAAQAADHATEATGETPPLVNKLTALHAPFVLADKYLGQHLAAIPVQQADDIGENRWRILSVFGVFILRLPSGRGLFGSTYKKALSW
jgi:hypothetical protein